jgi:DeoR/GlpR family transcriptional regulator of sugar metabolism
VLVNVGAEVVGLVTAQKLDTAATYVVESIHALTYLVTAATVPHEMLVAYKDLDITIIRDEGV